MQALKPKFLLHTAEYQLLVETHSWHMNGYWPRFDAIIQTYKLFISGHFNDTLLINMLKALDPYLQRKVIKEPKPATLEEAIERTWRVFHTAQPQYHSHRLLMQLRLRTPRQLPRQYMCLRQRHVNGLGRDVPGGFASESLLLLGTSPGL